jgi:hypothetical protein
MWSIMAARSAKHSRRRKPAWGKNLIAGYVIVQAESQEAAAKMFEGHPHFSIFPGESVEVMQVVPIPGS